MIAEAIIRTASRKPSEATLEDIAPENPLEVLEREYPDLSQFVTGKRVLDFGCGTGDQTAALTRKYGAVATGLDINLRWLTIARERYPYARYATETDGLYDTVISLNAMEHYADPFGALAQMRAATKLGGHILITFGPPWFAPFGHHMHYFCPIPWLNLIFPERAVMAVRSQYKSDGAKRYMEVEGGLNKMSVRKFERLIDSFALKVVLRRYTAVKGIHALTKPPLLRELFVNHITVVLERS